MLSICFLSFCLKCFKKTCDNMLLIWHLTFACKSCGALLLCLCKHALIEAVLLDCACTRPGSGPKYKSTIRTSYIEFWWSKMHVWEIIPIPIELGKEHLTSYYELDQWTSCLGQSKWIVCFTSARANTLLKIQGKKHMPKNTQFYFILPFSYFRKEHCQETLNKVCVIFGGLCCFL